MKNVLEINVDDMGFGGVFSLVKNVIEANARNEKSDVHIDIACIEPYEKQENVEYLKSLGTTVHYVGFAGNKIKKQFVIMKKLCGLLKAGEYSVAHIHGDVAYKLLVYAVASRLAGVPKIILHSHASDVDGNHRGLKKFMHYGSCLLLKALATDYVSCSDLASRWMFPNVRKSKIVNINNGVDLSRFLFNEAMRSAAREKYGLGDDDFVLGHVGRFAYQKNHEFLINVFNEVHKVKPDAKLLLIGTGELEEQTRQQVTDLGLDDFVIFGGLTNEVQAAFAAMDAFLLPSHFEGLPIVGVEAQASGLPCLFADTTTREGKILDDVCFLGIGPRDAARWAKRISALAPHTGEERAALNAHLRAAHFDLSDTVAQFLELYK